MHFVEFFFENSIKVIILRVIFESHSLLRVFEVWTHEFTIKESFSLPACLVSVYYMLYIMYLLSDIKSPFKNIGKY